MITESMECVIIINISLGLIKFDEIVEIEQETCSNWTDSDLSTQPSWTMEKSNAAQKSALELTTKYGPQLYHYRWLKQYITSNI